jgi:hemerythrin superfamily protein
MFGLEEELNDEIQKLKLENQELKSKLSNFINRLPTHDEIEKESLRHDAEYMSEDFFEQGARWVIEQINKY